jgi:hypothetical protein
VVLEGETRTRAGGRDLELVHDLLPQFIVCDALEPTPEEHRLKELADVEFSATNLRHFKVLHAQVFLELDQFFLKVFALAFLVFAVNEFEFLRETD